MLIIGEKYYKIEDDKLTILRVTKIEENRITVREGINRKYIEESFLDTFIRLKPNGHLFFNIVDMGQEGAEDVLVTLIRAKDIDSGIRVPYCACRQGIFDAFTNMTNHEDIEYVGMSMSVDTVPENIEFNSILACSGVKYCETIAIYMDDSLDTILGMINDRMAYDRVLYRYFKVNKDGKYVGISRSLTLLLKENDFMYDFYKAFDIEKVPYVVKYDKESLELITDQRKHLENLFKCEMFTTYVTRYNNTINMNKIERTYNMIVDKLNFVYIIAYDKGEYINPAYRDNIKDKRDAIAMMKIHRSKK